jgi:hypothetical protein
MPSAGQLFILIERKKVWQNRRRPIHPDPLFSDE